MSINIKNWATYIKQSTTLWLCILQILLFPEGTDLTPTTKARSDRFAEKNDLPKYNHVLHPRTTGFAFLVQKMREGECSVVHVVAACVKCSNSQDLVSLSASPSVGGHTFIEMTNNHQICIIMYNCFKSSWKVQRRLLVIIRAPPLGGCPIVITMSVCLSVRPSIRLSVKNTFTLAITFLPLEISLSHLVCVILMTRPFQRCHKFWTCDLDRDLWPTFEKPFTLAITF